VTLCHSNVEIMSKMFVGKHNCALCLCLKFTFDQSVCFADGKQTFLAFIQPRMHAPEELIVARNMYVFVSKTKHTQTGRPEL